MKIIIEIDNSEIDGISFRYITKLMEYLSKEEEQNKPINNEISKHRLFIEIFNKLYGHEEKDVNMNILFGELIHTGKFNMDDCNKFLKLTLSNGLIYERRKGYYAKA